MSCINQTAIGAARLPHAARRRARGLSIVELMVGITIGLFILAGATMVLTSQLGDNRRLLLEAQMQQDMRATADMIARDIRRAGYWAHAICQVWLEPGKVIAPECANAVSGAGEWVTNPYGTMTPRAAPAGTQTVVYDRSTDEESAGLGEDDDLVDDVADRTREQVGFRLRVVGDRQTVQYLVGEDNWQDLTDPEVLKVTQFTLALNARDLALPCGVQCPVLGPGGCPLVQSVRDVTITLVAEARHDATARRTLQDNVRLRNDVVREVCGP